MLKGVSGIPLTLESRFMKRFAFLGAAWILLLSGIGLPVFAASVPGDLDVRIVSVEGEVTIFLHNHVGEGVPAADGMPLEAGDRVKIGGESRADLGIDGESLIDLGSDSNLTLASVKRKSSAFELASGSLLAKIKAGLLGDDGTMEIRTPMAVAAVRGAEFAVEESAEGAKVGVFDKSKVAVRNPKKGGVVLLDRNQETSVVDGQAPAAPRSLDHFAGRREAMAGLRHRTAGLSSHWKPLPGAERAKYREKLFNRKRNLMRQVRERQREMRRRHPERKATPAENTIE